MPSIKIENPGELVALRLVVLSGKFPPEERESRIVGSPLVAGLCDRIFSIPLMERDWEMDVESNGEIFDSVKRDVEFAATYNYWGKPTEEELDGFIRNLVSPFSISLATAKELKKLYLSLAVKHEPETIEDEITGGNQLFFHSSSFEPIEKRFSLELAQKLGSGEIFCSVKFFNVSRFQISSDLRPEEIGFDDITRVETAFGCQYSFWTPGGYIKFFADLDLEINHTTVG